MTLPDHKRVVVTGMGAVSAIGADVPSFWQALCRGESGIGPVTKVPGEDAHSSIAAEVDDDALAGNTGQTRPLMLDPFAHYALTAAAEAIEQSKLAEDSSFGRHAAIIMGTGFGGDTSLNQSMSKLYGSAPGRVHPLSIPRSMYNAAACQISIAHNITGPVFTVSSACASATHAIGQAFWMVRSGMVTAAITGGSDACITAGTLHAWRALGAMTTDTCRPFSRDRSGIVIGEGAGVLVLEQRDSAIARGANILGEIAGFGMSADAGDIVQPSEEGCTSAMTNCLADAHMPADAFQHVNAHGTGTPLNDVTETRSLRRVFGDRAAALSISATKSMHGHAMGASGALEAVAAMLAIRDGIAPPTKNFTKADPECDLDYTPNYSRAMTIDAALSNSFAFGGLNGVLAFRRIT
jgi:nodulation protein E